MTTGFGVDRASNGSGTSAVDIRKIQGGLYTPGVISGCLVTTSPSGMQYSITAGVVAIRAATNEIILAPVNATTITTSPASSRTDIVYVKQRYPNIAGEGDSEVVVGVGTTLPDRAVEIRRYNLSAGQTNTNQATVSGNVSYSIPYGATLGRLHYYQHTLTGLGGSLPGFTRYGHGSFYLPTDRLLRFKLTAVMASSGAAGFDNSRFCEYGFIPNLNGADFVLWSSGGLHQAWQTHYFEATINAPQGLNLVNCIFTKLQGPGTPVAFYGTGGDGYGRRGIEFIVEDIGPTP